MSRLKIVFVYLKCITISLVLLHTFLWHIFLQELGLGSVFMDNHKEERLVHTIPVSVNPMKNVLPSTSCCTLYAVIIKNVLDIAPKLLTTEIKIFE